MRHSSDVTALVTGLLFLLLALLGLWSAFGTINWGLLGLALPLCLVIIGIAGLGLSRHK
jgi:hypothetical protein